MQHYRKTSHTTYDCKYHIVWITKYRKPVMTGLVGERVRRLIRGICKENEASLQPERFLLIINILLALYAPDNGH